MTIVKVGSVAGSLRITIPHDVVRDHEISEGDPVEVVSKPDHIEVWKVMRVEPRSLSELLPSVGMDG